MKWNPTRIPGHVEQKFLEKWWDRPNWAKRSMKRAADVSQVENWSYRVMGRQDLGDKDVAYRI